jgi:hypothetical protein
VSDRDRAQQWLAEVLHQAGTGGCDCGLAEPGDRDFYSGILAAAILDTPGVEVEEQWGTRHLDIETGRWETFACADLAAASASFDYLNEVWGHHAELVHRSVLTTPWESAQRSGVAAQEEK